LIDPLINLINQWAINQHQWKIRSLEVSFRSWLYNCIYICSYISCQL